jgi:hypothetical protein
MALKIFALFFFFFFKIKLSYCYRTGVLNHFCAMDPFEGLVKPLQTPFQKNVFKCIK